MNEDPQQNGDRQKVVRPSDGPTIHRPNSGGILSVYAADEQTAEPVDTIRWMKLAEQVLEAEGVMAHGGNVEVSLLFVDEATISSHNLQFMGKVGPTDVLSFPIDDPRVDEKLTVPIGGSPFALDFGDSSDRADFLDDDEDEAPTLLGDVLICPSVAARNAPDHAGETHNGSLDDELALLVVHGLLHLLGMDHIIDAEAEIMEAREQMLLDLYHRLLPMTDESGDSQS